MTEERPQILNEMDEESIHWQYCAICGEQKQRVVKTANRPDYALCDHCQSAFVLELGGKMRMLYGQLPQEMHRTRAFALNQWRKYFEVRSYAEKERNALGKEAVAEDQIPQELQNTLDDALPITFSDHEKEILDLEAKKTDILYTRQKKLEPPPRRLRETGELPDLDDLFKGNNKDS